jgi:hypothetical protein
MVGASAGTRNHRARCKLAQPLSQLFHALVVGSKLEADGLGSLCRFPEEVCLLGIHRAPVQVELLSSATKS